MLPPGRQIDLPLSPLEALARWPADSPVRLLHSGRYDPRWSRYSILTQPAGGFQFIADTSDQGHGRWTGPRDGSADACPFDPAHLTDRPFRDLRLLTQSAGDGLWIGYISYDLNRWIEKLPATAKDDRHWPLIDLAWCPGYLRFDNETKQWSACGLWRNKLPVDLLSRPATASHYEAGIANSLVTRDAYEAMVSRAMEYIGAGDIFQVNLAQRFTAAFDGEHPRAARALFARLATISPAWYGAYLELLTDVDGGQGRAPGRAIASTSPELFLEVAPDRSVITRPIKGTRPASAHPDELLHSEKDAAELNMIVDLLRNDLGRVCSYGSVQVAQPRMIESHPTIHHGVATVAGRLHPSKDVIDLLRATLPGGSITGAPKIRAMQIIDELEPVRRGPYCGCIGWLSRDAMCMNITIRTLLVDAHQQRVDFSVGGGIVADSQPAAEYEETLAKAKAMIQALATH